MKKILLSGILMLCLTIFALPILAQNVRGKVIAADNSSIPGASIVVQGKFVGTSTNNDGVFALNVNFDKVPVVLEISYLGYETQKISLNGPNSDLKITLKEAVINFDEVVVSASRVEERILEAPVTVTKISSKQLLAGGGPEMFSNLAKYQGGYFSHYTLENKSPFDRMKALKIEYRTAGENLALAQTVEIAHSGLMKSKGHRENILNSKFNRVGIGIMDGGIYGLMVTQNFRN